MEQVKKPMTAEFDFEGKALNGFVMLTVALGAFLCGLFTLIIFAHVNDGWAVAGVALMMFSLLSLFGLFQVEPNEARVMVFFGTYRGTFKRHGFYWVHPFMSKRSVSLRSRNLEAEPIKVNDKEGNPVMIGMVLVWRLCNTYKAMFEIDAQNMAASLQWSSDTKKNGETGGRNALSTNLVSNRMLAFEHFVKIQSDAALRQVASLYAYDDNEQHADGMTLRSGGKVLNEMLEKMLQERLNMSGIEVVEARINYLAYAPEIAAVMLRRQQAAAIIGAREKIVEGAVSMVGMALERLSEQHIVELDEEKKAEMVSHLLVVLCSEQSVQPVLNTGTMQ